MNHVQEFNFQQCLAILTEINTFFGFCVWYKPQVHLSAGESVGYQPPLR